MTQAVRETNFPDVPLFARGKVRDVYDLGNNLLIVATDRVSAFDVVMPTPIPGRGIILTQMSLFWFRLMDDIVSNHVVTADVSQFPNRLQKYADVLEGRSMIVRKANRIDIECVVRGYLAGSGWKDYKKTGTVCGHELPPGLVESSRLPEPIFTPATKAESGHDENISVDHAAEIIGKEVIDELERLSIALYERGRSYADSRGIIIADTKFEFGWIDNRLSLIDEVLSPDSSRFWPKDSYEAGRSQDSFDKQYVRDYLETTGWDKESAPPPLPDDIVAKTREKYVEAYRKLTGKDDF